MLNLCSHSVIKLHEASQMFMMVDYVRGMTVKSCRYGEYGSLSICSSCLMIFFPYLPCL